ncbi:MAG: hypothetical protein GF405_02905 [Candidatus Eisenbacteria bacterium]|nr:hypothetical protein [Candidatus Eisenbacteria bacterium]
MLYRVTAITLLLVAFGAGGCSDDITCPDADDAAARPSIRAFVRQTTLGSPATTATITVGADPVPSLLIASVNYRDFGEPELIDGPLLRATMEEEQVVWQPGTPCTLRVSTDSGFARAPAVVPEAASVSAPATVSLGDSLALHWSLSADADYYAVRAVVRSGPDSLVIETTTVDTSLVIAAQDLSMTGELAGVVSAVSGPLPAQGSSGNVTGEGWGFFSVSYETGDSSFEVEVVGSSRIAWSYGAGALPLR